MICENKNLKIKNFEIVMRNTKDLNNKSMIIIENFILVLK